MLSVNILWIQWNATFYSWNPRLTLVPPTKHTLYSIFEKTCMFSMSQLRTQNSKSNWCYAVLQMCMMHCLLHADFWNCPKKKSIKRVSIQSHCQHVLSFFSIRSTSLKLKRFASKQYNHINLLLSFCISRMHMTLNNNQKSITPKLSTLSLERTNS